MATVTGLTAARMLEIEAASVVDGSVDAAGNLTFTTHDGTPIDAGNVKGPQGLQGIKGDKGDTGDTGPEGPSKTATNLPYPDTLALRDASGRFQVASPSAASDVVTKSYADFGSRKEQFQHALTGGGIKTVHPDGTINWSQRFIAISQAKGTDTATAGYFDITCPPAGTVIPSASGGSSITVAAGGRVPMANWSALWYIPPWGSGSATVNANYRWSIYTDPNFVIPSDWILVAVVNADGGGCSFLKWGTGELDDYWRPITLLNGWLNYETSEPAPGATNPWCKYKKIGNDVYVIGIMKNGPLTTAFTLPVGYRPIHNMHKPTLANLGLGAIRYQGNGNADVIGGSNTWFDISTTFLAEL